MNGDDAGLPEAILDAHDRDFDAIVSGATLPLLIDFHAPWCPVSAALERALPGLARKVSGRARIVRVDVSRSPRITCRFGVRRVPTFVLIVSGRPRGVQEGFLGAAGLLRWLDSKLLGA